MKDGNNKEIKTNKVSLSIHYFSLLSREFLGTVRRGNPDGTH